MKKTMMIATLITPLVGIAGCGKKAETPEAAAPVNAMANMVMSTDAKTGKSSGKVLAIDRVAGKITLDHDAVPAVGWPAMKMGFSAKPDLLTGIVVGDRVHFDVAVTGNAGEITAIEKQE